MKPTHAKPNLYSYYFFDLKEIAKDFGYNLVVHGSMNRDLDLIAIPWIDDPKPELDMIQELYKYLTGNTAHENHWKDIYMYKELPGGRHAYVLNLNRGGYKRNDNGDISDPIKFVANITLTFQ